MLGASSLAGRAEPGLVGPGSPAGRSGSTAESRTSGRQSRLDRGWQEMVHRVGLAGVAPPREGAESRASPSERSSSSVCVAPRSASLGISAIEEFAGFERRKARRLMPRRLAGGLRLPRGRMLTLHSHGREPRDRPEDERRNDLHDMLCRYSQTLVQGLARVSRDSYYLIRHFSSSLISEVLHGNRNSGNRRKERMIGFRVYWHQACT